MRIIFILLLFLLKLFASSPEEIEVKIFEKIISNFDKNNTIQVYSNDKQIANSLKKYSKKLKITDKNNSKIFILSHYLKTIPKNKIVIVTNYELLKELNNSVVAFYWKKGRPNIFFIKERLKRFHLKINKDYKKYLEEERCLYELCF